PNHRTWTVPKSTNAASRYAPVTRTGSTPTATASAAKTDPMAREPMRPDQQAQDTRHHQRAIGGQTQVQLLISSFLWQQWAAVMWDLHGSALQARSPVGSQPSLGCWPQRQS